MNWLVIPSAPAIAVSNGDSAKTVVLGIKRERREQYDRIHMESSEIQNLGTDGPA
jgi:hypothetical protein